MFKAPFPLGAILRLSLVAGLCSLGVHGSLRAGEQSALPAEEALKKLKNGKVKFLE